MQVLSRLFTGLTLLLARKIIALQDSNPPGRGIEGGGCVRVNSDELKTSCGGEVVRKCLESI